jgi:hypothetical protein
MVDRIYNEEQDLKSSKVLQWMFQVYILYSTPMFEDLTPTYLRGLHLSPFHPFQPRHPCSIPHKEKSAIPTHVYDCHSQKWQKDMKMDALTDVTTEQVAQNVGSTVTSPTKHFKMRC